MKSIHRSKLTRALMAGAASLACVMIGAAAVRAETVAVLGSDGLAGADGVNPNDPGLPGGDGESATANAGSTQPVTFPLNKATATGGNGGQGGNGGPAPAGTAGEGDGGNGGNGGAANATASTAIASGSAEAVANSFGGNGGFGGSASGGPDSAGADGNGGAGGGADASSSASSSGSGDALSSAIATAGPGGSTYDDGFGAAGGGASATSVASTEDGAGTATSSGSGGAAGSGFRRRLRRWCSCEQHRNVPWVRPGDVIGERVRRTRWRVALYPRGGTHPQWRHGHRRERRGKRIG
jgi:hypothetical protein